METKIKVTGMTCSHCVGTVTKVLENVPGVEQAKVNLQTGQVTVAGKADTAILLEAIRGQGYEAQVI